MAEYIERKKAIDLFYPVDSENDGSDGCTIVCKSRNFSSAEIETMLSELSAADVVPVRHGRWILVDKSYGEYECSVCHARDSDCSGYYGTHTVLEQKHCPHCGAKMDLED